MEPATDNRKINGPMKTNAHAQSLLTRLTRLGFLVSWLFAHAQFNGANLGYGGAFCPTWAVTVGLTDGNLLLFVCAAETALSWQTKRKRESV
jgi:hypothetical protein